MRFYTEAGRTWFGLYKYKSLFNGVIVYRWRPLNLVEFQIKYIGELKINGHVQWKLDSEWRPVSDGDDKVLELDFRQGEVSFGERIPPKVEGFVKCIIQAQGMAWEEEIVRFDKESTVRIEMELPKERIYYHG